MGNDYSIPGYYKLAEVKDFDHIMPVSSRNTLPVRHFQNRAGKKNSIQLRPSKYRASTPQAKPGSVRSKKSRRQRIKKKPKMPSMKKTDSGIDFRAINSIICSKTPIVLAFLASETKLNLKHRNPQASGISLCSRCKKETRATNKINYDDQLRSQQHSKHHNPCIQYCKYCKIKAFPCADYCRACCKSVSRESQKH